MQTQVVIMSGPKSISLGTAGLTAPGAGDLVVDIAWSGISTGTEKLFWMGTMPPFPGMGYPLVPGYESVGRVRECGSRAGGRRPGGTGAVAGRGRLRAAAALRHPCAAADPRRGRPVATVRAEC